MSAESLKEKMKEFTEGKAGSVKIDSSDLSTSGKNSKDGSGETTGTVEADVPQEAKDDVFTEAGAASELHQQMIPPSYLKEEKIDITEEDRSAFLKAIVSGERYERDFSLFGGKLTGVFRCRKVAESDGIIAWLSHCVNEKKIDARIDYLTTMRNALLTAQVKSLRGMVNEDFPEMAGPYAPTRSEDGKSLKDPGWVQAAESWGSRAEALVTALHSELLKFEKRYWTMIMDAGNQNFWNPATSI